MQENPKRQQLVTAHAVTVPTTPAPTKPYVGNLPKWNRCNFHHHGTWREMHCTKCNWKEHTVRFCKQPTQPAVSVAIVGVCRPCYECGATGHFRRDCPKANNGNTGESGWVFAMGQMEATANPTVVTGMFLVDNSYTCILFDSGVERSFVSHIFTNLLKLIKWNFYSRNGQQEKRKS